MVEVLERWLLWTWNDTCKIHILWLISDIQRQIQAHPGDDSARCTSSSHIHPFRIEEIYMQGKVIASFLSSINKKHLRLQAAKLAEELGFKWILDKGRKRRVKGVHEIITSFIHHGFHISSREKTRKIVFEVVIYENLWTELSFNANK
jgi:hypothetical protein